MRVNLVKYLLIAMYTAGLLGLNIPLTRELFQALTPFNLMVSSIMLILYQQEKNQYFYLSILLLSVLGYGIEVLGVNTGLIFGHYQYLHVLGFKILNTPPMIGLLWFLITICTVNLLAMRKVIGNVYFKSLIGAIIMTIFDFLAEPTAIRLSMWSWTDGTPPLQNYLAWFIFSYFLIFLSLKLPFKKENPISGLLLALQILFFGIQLLF